MKGGEKMDNKIILELISVLHQDSYISSKNLGDLLEVSSKTIRTRVREANVVLEKNGAHILAKPKLGLKLEIIDQSLYDRFIKELTSEELILPNSQSDRVRYILEYLLICEGFIKLEDLSDQLFISRTSLSNDMKIVRKKLQDYDLKIETRPKYGMKIIGEEINKRLCISNFISQKGDQRLTAAADSDLKVMLVRVTEILNQIFRKNDFHISDFAYQNLISHIYVALQRINMNENVKMTNEEVADLKSEFPIEYDIAGQIRESISKELGTTLLEPEIAYITIHLASKKIIDLKSNDSHNMIVTEEINLIVKEMLESIYEYFKIDFRNDLELRMALATHLIPLKVRVSYNLNFKNPLLKEIKNRFVLAYTIAVQACDILRMVYKKDIGEDEIGYFALYFNLALERQKKGAKKNILIVCSSGKGTSQLLVFRFKSEFSNQLNVVDTSDIFQLESADFSKYDYVITTVPLSLSIPIPILEVKHFLEDQDIQAVKRLLSTTQSQSMNISKFFDKQLFLTDVDFDNKKSVIRYMVNKIHQFKQVPNEFYHSVLERENQAVTEFGNYVAIPHPNKALSEETFVCVAILKKPIIWDKRKVQFVFLMSIENNTTKNLECFYKITGKLLINKDKIKSIIRNKSYHFFMETLTDIQKELYE